jgi:Hydantoinase B/oxoprolinase/Hydantoinase/oxoprolinase C-terminal domain
LSLTRQEFARTLIRTTDQAETADVQQILAELQDEATKWMEFEGIPPEKQVLSCNADMRYYRQGYELPIQFELEELADQGLNVLVERFSQLHDQYYGFLMEGTRTEIVNLRVIAVGKMTDPALPEGASGAGDASHAISYSHQVYFAGEWQFTNIYIRAKLQPGIEIPGPAIVTEFDSTTVILPGYTRYYRERAEMMRDYKHPVRSGDVIMTSDPYLCGGAISHVNDWLVLVPIFFQGELIGWASMFGHQMDSGGPLAGSLPTGARTIFGEGIRIPPVKVFSEGKLQDDVVDLILNNVRQPEMNRADLLAIVAGCHTGEKRWSVFQPGF